MENTWGPDRLPGAGCDIAAFAGYAEAKRSAPDRDDFGKGALNGVAAPEAANNAATAGALVPGHHVSLRAYADRIVLVADNEVIAQHKRRFTKNISYFEPWHYVPLLARKPGALRNGAPFVEWQLPTAMNMIKARYMKAKGGDRDFVELLDDGPGAWDMARLRAHAKRT